LKRLSRLWFDIGRRSEQLATLVPNAGFFAAKDSGHDIHQDQPEPVTEARSQSEHVVRSNILLREIAISQHAQEDKNSYPAV